MDRKQVVQLEERGPRWLGNERGPRRGVCVINSAKGIRGKRGKRGVYQDVQKGRKADRTSQGERPLAQKRAAKDGVVRGRKMSGKGTRGVARKGAEGHAARGEPGKEGGNCCTVRAEGCEL